MRFDVLKRWMQQHPAALAYRSGHAASHLCVTRAADAMKKVVELPWQARQSNLLERAVRSTTANILPTQVFCF